MAWIGNHISSQLWKAKTKWEKLYPFGKFEDDKLNGDLYLPVLCWNSLGHILVAAAIVLLLNLPSWAAPSLVTALAAWKEINDKGSLLKRSLDIAAWLIAAWGTYACL